MADTISKATGNARAQIERSITSLDQHVNELRELAMAAIAKYARVRSSLVKTIKEDMRDQLGLEISRIASQRDLSTVYLELLLEAESNAALSCSDISLRR